MSSDNNPTQPEAAGGGATGRTVRCVKIQKQLPGLKEPPWPGELGQRIYENVSAEAWKLWEERMKMILNEYRLMPWQKRRSWWPSIWRTSFSAKVRRSPQGTSRRKRSNKSAHCSPYSPLAVTGMAVSITTRRRACAARRAVTAVAGDSVLANMNPR